MNTASLMGSRLGHFDFDDDAEVTEAAEEPRFRRLGIAVGEVGATEVGVFHPIPQMGRR
ncbi:MAG: hypothetical protein M3541_06540 [Acidobacteriota bacterium]|nr:hypothetical protein [Acidobacteriota bacterium]